MGYETRCLIGGELMAGEGAPIEVENPVSEEIVARVGSASPGQLELAVK
ncbi:MAG: hypothetical protein IT199_06145, partial [Solirubrobacterales bacterium]|nr:hypothetical protein [Solirubrobacterales bacterium]